MDKKDKKTVNHELDQLRKEIEKAREREKDLNDTRRAMLYLLEDVNETTAEILRAKKDWEHTFDSIKDPLFLHDGDFRIIRANKSYKEAAGMEFKDIIGKPYYEVFPKNDKPLNSCISAFERLEELSEEMSVMQIDKVYKVRSYPVTSNNNYLYSIHVMEDITEKKEVEQRERILYDLSREIASDIGISFRFQKICDMVVKIGYRMAWLGSLDEMTKEVLPRTQSGFEEGYLSSIKIRFDESELGRGPTGMAIKTKCPVIQNHILSDPNYAPWRDEAVKRGYKSSAAFPVACENKVIGVLNVYNEKEEFPQKDLRFLETLANQSAIYIKEAFLFEELKKSEEKVRQELELSSYLLMMADAASRKTDEQRLMEEVVRSCHAIMGSDVCLSYLWNDSSKAFDPSHAVGLSHELLPFFKTEPLNERVSFLNGAMKGETILEEPSPDGFNDSFLRHIDNIGVLMVIPFIGRVKPLGVIVGIFLKKEKPCPIKFSPRIGELMKGISSEVSTALEEVHSYKESVDRAIELSNKIETIKVMHEIDRTLLSSLDSNEILEVAVRMINKLIPCDRGTVALIDKDKKGFIYKAGFGVTFLDKGSFVGFEDTNATEVIKTGRPQYIPNLMEIKDLPPLEQTLVKEGFRSHIRVPLVLKEGITGVLSIGAKRFAGFTQKDLSTLEAIAAQICVALENAKLLTEINELFMGTIRSLSEAIDAKSKWTSGHSKRVTDISLFIARELGFNENMLKRLELAGLLHDIGKIGTYETILDKPGKLTQDEQSVIREHPVKGSEILKHIKQFDDIIPGIRHHHEFYDGSGYPDGLKGEAIPLFSRILSVADTVDAMAADRPYRKGRDVFVIMDELKRCSAAQFDPLVVGAFLRAIEKSSYNLPS